MTKPLIFPPRPPKAPSTSTNGSAMAGDLIFTPERLYPRLHHRTRLHGRVAARIREAKLQDYRAERGPGKQSRKVGSGYRRDSGPQGELPDDRRPGTQSRQAL